MLATFDAETREASRVGLVGLRRRLRRPRGSSLNEAIASLNPFLRDLKPVMENLSDPDTELSRLLPRASGERRARPPPWRSSRPRSSPTWPTPSTPSRATRAPFSRPSTRAPRRRSPRSAPSASSVPFLADFADLSRRLRPAARELRRSLPPLNSALLAGTDVLVRVPSLTNDLSDLFGELEDLGNNPNTLLAIRDLSTTVDVGRPGVEFIAPFQTVCNYASYFLNPLGTHISQPGGGGTVERVLLKQADREQRNGLTSRNNSRPVDTATPGEAGPNPPAALHTQYGGSAIDPNGDANCAAGQTGYPTGRLSANNRYGPNELGGMNVVLDPNNLGTNRGGTFKSRELGIDNLEDVP